MTSLRLRRILFLPWCKAFTVVGKFVQDWCAQHGTQGGEKLISMSMRMLIETPHMNLHP